MIAGVSACSKPRALGLCWELAKRNRGSLHAATLRSIIILQRDPGLKSETWAHPQWLLQQDDYRPKCRGVERSAFLLADLSRKYLPSLSLPGRHIEIANVYLRLLVYIGVLPKAMGALTIKPDV